MENEIVKGYKVFLPDWTCSPFGNTKQYSCPGRFKQDGELSVCDSGMHFCQRLADCFAHYTFSPKNKVAEVIAHGEVIQEGGKCCTNDLEIVREIEWGEVLELVNEGENCTGIHNVGSYNVGHQNVGNYCDGRRNVGNYCVGSHNVGNHNEGSYNVGNGNVGRRNVGRHNEGSWNVGSHNVGSHNVGDWNRSSFSAGCFMTEEQKIMMFNKPSTWTMRDWLKSDAKCFLDSIPKKVTVWVWADDMTGQEKAEHPEYTTTGGYLKTTDGESLAQEWWDRLPEYKRKKIYGLPNFDAEIFCQCTGIKVDRDGGDKND